MQGIPVADRAYAGGWWDWLTPFSLLTGVALVVGYALLGATWLILKTSGELQAARRRFAWITGARHAGADRRRQPRGRRSSNPLYMERWFAWPAILYPRRCRCCVARRRLRAVLRPVHGNARLQPFLAALALFVLSYIGLGISFYPYIVPPLDHHLGGRGARRQPGLPAGRRRRADPDDPRPTPR